MPGPSREIILRLYRDALSTPWGFRLQGGKDLKLPLTVDKVNLGSPVDGELSRGDVILEIQNCDATTMSHQKAQEMIKNSGGSLLLRIRRSGYQAPAPSPPSAGLAIPPGQQGFMLQRIQDTLSTVKLDPHEYSSSAAGYYGNQQLSYQPNDNHHHLFTQPNAQQFASAHSATQRSSNQPGRGYATLPNPRNTAQQQLPLGLAEPGWTPNLSFQRAPVTRTGERPRTYAQPPPPPASVSVYDRPRSLEPEKPAWEGSLRSSINPHLTDMRIDIQSPHSGTSQEIAHFSPTGSRGQRQSSPWASESLGPGPRAVNLQYNSPLALYSKATAEETLRGQNFGNAQVRSESDVYALVHENDRRSAKAYNHEAFDTSFTDF